MRICVSGATKMSKTKLVQDFLMAFPNYKEVKLTFRDKIKEKLGDNFDSPDIMRIIRMGNKETQEMIRDSIIEQISAFSREDNVIYDRGLMDNLMYSLYLCSVGADGCDGDWMTDQLPIFRDYFKFYDVIMFTPLLTGYYAPVIPEGSIELDREIIFRSEQNNIFVALHKEYLDGKRNWLPKEDTPAILEIFGTPEERIQMIRLYVDEMGQPYDEDKSLVKGHLAEGLEFMEKFEELHEKTK